MDSDCRPRKSSKKACTGRAVSRLGKCLPWSNIPRKLFAFTTALVVWLALSAHADQWVTSKAPKVGHKLLGRAIFAVQIRADGTVKEAWPLASSVSSRVAWRATKSVKQLRFLPGAARTAKVPVTIFP